MPLKAKINNKIVISFDISENDWSRFKNASKSGEATIELLCCGREAYLRTSKLGTQHFVHKSKQKCDWKPESIEHLRAKEIIYKCCIEQGWRAEPEYCFEDCIADVYATHGRRKVAFEVQLTRQSEKDTVIRHEKYKKHGIRCVWFFKRIPGSLVSNKNLPAFELCRENNVFYVVISDRRRKFALVLHKLLNGEIKYRNKYTYKNNQIADIYKLYVKCENCGKETPVIGVHSFYMFHCGISGNKMYFDDEDLGCELAALQENGIKILSGIGPIKKRFSKIYKSSYWSNGCKWCGAIIEKHYLDNKSAGRFYKEQRPLMNVPFRLNKKKLNLYGCPHWCSGGDEGYCD